MKSTFQKLASMENLTLPTFSSQKKVTKDFLFIGYNNEALQKVLTDPKNVAALTNRTAMGKSFIQAVHCIALKYRKVASINACYKFKKFFFCQKYISKHQKSSL